jgi:hypothetical protein
MEKIELINYPKYFACSDGTIFSSKTNKTLNGCIDKNGYKSVNLFMSNYKGKSIRVHRLIAEAFIPNPDNKPQVNHINGIKTDNRIENLEWCTVSENAIHASKLGLLNPVNGEKHPRCKISNLQVVEIRALKDVKTISELAIKYNVERTTISDIINRKKRKNAEKYI